MWSVKVSKQVLKKAKELPPANRQKLIEFIQELQKTPFPQGFDIVPVKDKKAKQFGRKRGIYRVRIGEYRLIYIVNWKEKNNLTRRTQPKRKSIQMR